VVGAPVAVDEPALSVAIRVDVGDELMLHVRQMIADQE
jgi:hypothetical protein